MKKRQVGYNRLADEDDFNLLADYQEDNVELFAQDCGFAGCFLSGGAVTPHSPVSWEVILGISAARDDNGDRIKIASPETIDMEPSGDPGVGNDVYMSAFLSYTAVETEPDVDGHGVAYYKDYDDGYTITVTEGTPATSGTATPPAIPANSLCICDVLVTHAVYLLGTIQAGDIDISRQASFEWPDELGQTTITDTTESTTKDTGALIVEGGVGVEKRINAGGKIATTDTTDSSSKDTGSIITEGGIGVEKALFAGGKISTANQLESTLAIGTAPLAVTSTTKVSNLNVCQVDGCDVEDSDTLGTSDVKLPTQGNVKVYVDNAAPIGAVVAWPLSSGVPANWKECNGDAISRTTYSVLFGILSTTYGIGDGSTTFNLPDTENDAAFIRHYKNAVSGAIAAKQEDASQGHLHTINEYTTNAGTSGPVWHYDAATASKNNDWVLTTNAPTTYGAYGTPRVAAETRPVNFAMLYIIRVL